ncbi:MAG: bifunctional folylpolyglutamate synthase/dihydrofolate synthase [Rikenellaceae bacterium]|nr:bifunctional folylpolyglutamate synthase/dihydrofolate synthase [Rikenellaceae bacterium]
MNYTQTIDYLFNSLPSYQNVGADAYKPGLERIAEFCHYLGNPQRNYYTIHVAGTNGKGSVSHILASVLHEAGYCVGLYTSPHLKDFRERIKVDGEMISKQKVVNFVDRNMQKMEALGLSFFEMTTAMAFDHFAYSDVEVAIIETGLGGRLDATNLIVPLLSVITNVGMDHTALLGDTIGQIAREKAGIIKKSVPVVVGEADAAYNGVIEARAEELRSQVIYAQNIYECVSQSAKEEGQTITLRRLEDGFIYKFDMDLGGRYQYKNLITAAAAIRFLHSSSPLTISRRAFVEGVASAATATSFAGRWQVVEHNPLLVLDTGHNAHGVRLVSEDLKALSQRVNRLICVIGFSADKDIDEMLALLPREAYYIFTQASSERAAKAVDIVAKALASGLMGVAVGSVAEAMAQARDMAAENDAIFVGGSNFVVAEAL